MIGEIKVTTWITWWNHLIQRKNDWTKILGKEENPITGWWFQPLWSQVGSFPQVGMKLKNIWNHHLDHYCTYPKQDSWGGSSDWFEALQRGKTKSRNIYLTIPNMNRWTNRRVFDRKLEHVTPINMFITSYKNLKSQCGLRNTFHFLHQYSIYGQATNQSFFEYKARG